MRFFLIICFFLLIGPVKAQMCNTSSTNMGAIVPSGTWQNVTGASGAKRFWTFNATAGCTYDFSTCNSLFTNDTYLRLYSGTNPLTAVLQTFNDDNGPFCLTTKASLSWVCTTSGAYSILVTNYSCANLSASTILRYRVNCPVPPPNDNCAGAISIASLPYTSPVTSNNPSTNDVPTSPTGCGTHGSNLWYTVVGNGNLLTATTCNASTNFDTEIRVYTGSCATLNSMVEIVCNDDDATCSSGTLKSTVSWCSELGTTYYISVGYYSSSPGYGNFVLSVTNGASCGPLPIELIEFSGTQMNGSVLLEWRTASELNNDYFVIERANGAMVWKTVAQIPGAGTISYEMSYSCIDSSPYLEETNYYKLTQVDHNGTRESFPIIAVNLKSLQKDCDKIYYDLNGKEIDFINAAPGIYIVKCGNEYKKVRKIE